MKKKTEEAQKKKEVAIVAIVAEKNDSQDDKEETDFQHEIAKIAKIATSLKKKHNILNEEVKHDVMSATPLINKDVYCQLPSFLKECTEHFDCERSRDVFLTGAITLLSGVIPNVSGEYHNQIILPNLFSFIIAPPANWKGTLGYVHKLGSFYHDQLVAESQNLIEDFNIELRSFEKNKGTENSGFPKKPPYKLLYIPANCSSAKIHTHLSENLGKGILFETEADSLGNMFNKDWSTYSDLLRKAFHQEPITFSRSTNDNHIEIKDCSMAVLLSGTPNQIYKIIPSAEDGLFSRFIFYLYRTEDIWISPRPTNAKKSLPNFFDAKGKEVVKLVDFFKSNPSIFKVTQEQWDKSDLYFTHLTNHIPKLMGGDAKSVVFRLGVINYRIAMIFTALRKFEQGDKSSEIYCNDIDYQNALELTDVYLQHSLILFENMKKSTAHQITKFPPAFQKLYGMLPDKSNRAEILNISKEIGLPVRTVDYNLNRGKGVIFDCPEPGAYNKIS